jgi:CDP-diacylglycerol--glycerol-3-phosphate 3-phosphatidyltransferase/cardiolipin synthase
MVAVALVLLVQADPRTLLALPAAVIIGREITVSALREWMAEVGARGKVAVSSLGKVKTTAQMISIVLLLLRDTELPRGLYALGLGLLYLAAVLTLWSMLVYLRAAWPALSAGSRTSADPGVGEAGEAAGGKKTATGA